MSDFTFVADAYLEASSSSFPPITIDASTVTGLGIEPGDLILLDYITTAGNITSVAASPGGYTVLVPYTAGSTGQAFLYKVADASDATTAITLTPSWAGGGINGSALHVTVWRSVDPADPIDAYDTDRQSPNTTVDPPTVVTSWGATIDPDPFDTHSVAIDVYMLHLVPGPHPSITRSIVVFNVRHTTGAFVPPADFTVVASHTHSGFDFQIYVAVGGRISNGGWTVGYLRAS